MFKFVIFAAAIAATNAILASPYGGVVAPAIVGQDSNIIRSFGNLGQVAHQSKTINTPFSSVSKSDIRVSNPGYLAAPAYHGYGAPAYQGAYAAPAYHHGLAAPLGAPWGVPAVAKVGVAPAGSLLGVAYSPAVAVSHMSYQAPAISYAW